MKREQASLLALATVSLADHLAPNDVPLACVNICGPIVELSAICHLDGPNALRKIKRRKLAETAQESPQKRARGSSNRHTSAEHQRKDEKEKRQVDSGTEGGPQAPQNHVPPPVGEFKTITNGVQPTTRGALPPLNPPPTAQQPVHPGPALPPITPTTTARSPVQTTTRSSSSSSTIENTAPPRQTSPLTGGGEANNGIGAGGEADDTDDDGDEDDDDDDDDDDDQVEPGDRDNADDIDDDGAGADNVDEGPLADIDESGGNDGMRPDYGQQRQQQQQDLNDLETECICENESFDVGRISGLCADCIVQTEDDKSPMEAILFQCNFTTDRFEPEKESLVASVTVEATRPEVSGESSETAPRLVEKAVWNAALVATFSLGFWVVMLT